MAKTLRQVYYEELPNWVAELAIANTNPKMLDSEYDMTLSSNYTFDWRETPEGSDFWEDVYLSLEEFEILKKRHGGDNG